MNSRERATAFHLAEFKRLGYDEIPAGVDYSDTIAMLDEHAADQREMCAGAVGIEGRILKKRTTDQWITDMQNACINATGESDE